MTAKDKQEQIDKRTLAINIVLNATIPGVPQSPEWIRQNLEIEQIVQPDPRDFELSKRDWERCTQEFRNLRREKLRAAYREYQRRNGESVQGEVEVEEVEVEGGRGAAALGELNDELGDDVQVEPMYVHISNIDNEMPFMDVNPMYVVTINGEIERPTFDPTEGGNMEPIVIDDGVLAALDALAAPGLNQRMLLWMHGMLDPEQGHHGPAKIPIEEGS